MKLKTLLAAGASLLAMTSYAQADPISIGFFLFAGPLGSVFSFATLVTAAQIGLYAVGIGASLVAGQMGRQKIDPGQYKNTFDTSESSEVNAIGRVALGGLKVFGNTAGTDRYRLIAHAKGPLVAIEEYKLGGREVTVDPDGSVSSPPYAKPGGSWVTWQTKTGTGDETSWPDLQSAFSGLWTADHRVRGIAQSLVKYVSPGIYEEKFGELYQGGEPDATIVARMNTAYDPRDVAQDKDDADTWTWTDNGPLCAARIMLSYPDLTVDSFDWDFIADEADRADVLVATKTGTEKRSRCSGVWLSESERGTTMQQVLDSIGCEVVQSDGGLVRIRLIDDVPTSEISFSDRDILDWSWKSGPEAVERPNVCRIKFYSAERNYEMADIDMSGIGWARIDDEVTRYGEKPFDVELPFCPSASQAQRIARRMFSLARADAGVIHTNMAGLVAWGLTYASIELSDLGETPVCKIAAPRIDDENGTVDIPYAVWPTLAAWNPTTDEADAPEQVPDLQFESELDTPAAPTSAMVVTLPSAQKAVRIAYTLPADSGATIAEAVYRIVSGEGAFQSMEEYGDLEGAGAASGNNVDASGDLCEFKVRVFNVDGGSYFSDVLSVIPDAESAAAPAAPSAIYTTVPSQITVTQSPSLQATYVTCDGLGAPEGVQVLAPYQTLTYSPTQLDTGTTHTITAYNSAGVASAAFVVAVPGTGGA